jgi:hypothetical protein
VVKTDHLAGLKIEAAESKNDEDGRSQVLRASLPQDHPRSEQVQKVESRDFKSRQIGFSIRLARLV